MLGGRPYGNAVFTCVLSLFGLGMAVTDGLCKDNVSAMPASGRFSPVGLLLCLQQFSLCPQMTVGGGSGGRAYSQNLPLSCSTWRLAPGYHAVPLALVSSSVQMLPAMKMLVNARL